MLSLVQMKPKTSRNQIASISQGPSVCCDYDKSARKGSGTQPGWRSGARDTALLNVPADMNQKVAIGGPGSYPRCTAMATRMYRRGTRGREVMPPSGDTAAGGRLQ